MNLPVINLEQARFECTFGRGCEGICCRDGRPMVYPDEAANIDANLEKFLPELRPQARSLVAKRGISKPPPEKRTAHDARGRRLVRVLQQRLRAASRRRGRRRQVSVQAVGLRCFSNRPGPS